jgi:hypothetical protein
MIGKATGSGRGAWVAVVWARLAAGVAWQGSMESGRGSVAG